MSTKSEVLALLEKWRGQSVSGARIADELGVSRNAVWKAVKELERGGHRISAATNRGYCLADDDDILSAQGMSPFVDGDVDVSRIEVFDVLESTNITAKQRALAGAGHGTVIVADHQTAGRGRRGRSFYSPAGSGIYMSFILRPERLWVETHTLITALAAVSVCESIEACGGADAQIKWVNDVFSGGKKVCGILTEAVSDFESGGIQWIVVGIGVNVNTGAFPEELQGIAGCVFGDGGCSRNRLAAEIVNRMVSETRRISQDEVLTRYRSRLFMLGREVTVSGIGEPYRATAVSVDDEGRLVVRRGDGSEAVLQSGEISVK